MYHTYVLESVADGKLYVGQTNNLDDRLRRHTSGLSNYTRNRGPWRMLFSRKFASRSEAMKLEKQLKDFKNPLKIKDWISRNAL